MIHWIDEKHLCRIHCSLILKNHCPTLELQLGNSTSTGNQDHYYRGIKEITDG